MALITSRSLKGESEAPVAEKKIAKKDITIQNDLGQTVVVVPAGQPVPDDLDAAKKRAGAIQRTATEEQIAEARGETKRRGK